MGRLKLKKRMFLKRRAGILKRLWMKLRMEAVRRTLMSRFQVMTSLFVGALLSWAGQSEDGARQNGGRLGGFSMIFGITRSKGKVLWVKHSGGKWKNGSLRGR